MTNTQALLDVYQNFPCRTLPNAYWKTASRIDEGALDIQYGSEGELKSLMIWQDDARLVYWCANPLYAQLSSAILDQLDYALVHDISLDVFPGGKIKHRRPFFRLRHEVPMMDYHCPQGFAIRNARPETETEAVSRIIQRCYANMNVNPETVRRWLSHPVFDPDLWVWIVEAGSDRRVGLGIAELDARVPEASLEWIQVLSEYQNRGLGAVIVAELLHRVNGKVRFTTVSGELNNITQPERLYRKCGFVGSDIWWLLAF